MGQIEGMKINYRDIFLAFKMAFDPKKLFLGYLGLLVSLAWSMVVLAVSNGLKLVEVTPFIFIKILLSSVREGTPVLIKNVLLAISPLDIGEVLVSLILVLGLLALWSVVGGALTRIAVLDYARDVNLSLREALKFARRKFWTYFWSPMVPFVGVLFFALCNIILGLVGRVPVFGEVIVALGFPVALLSGILIFFVGVIGMLGICFMFPTISAEGSDAFDAMSRAYSYVLSRPKQYFFYFFIKMLYGLSCFVIIAFVAWLVMQMTFCTLGIGMGESFDAVLSFIAEKCNVACLGFCSTASSGGKEMAVVLDRWPLKFLAYVLIGYIFLIKLLVWNFAVTYIFSAKTIIYFLLRKDIDSTDVADVYVEKAMPVVQISANEGVESLR
ncbi:MAG: hypothetical protein MRJ65_01980 [Candidatus Brocadiaceae bacterium]|nr:hypothetical protein [Candidatus Brocadiaceae bacterium]